MESKNFVVVGYNSSSFGVSLQAFGPFRNGAEADDFRRDVLEHVHFKVAFDWRTVDVYDPEIYRRDVGDVAR